jgi:hypothetical protein
MDKKIAWEHWNSQELEELIEDDVDAFEEDEDDDYFKDKEDSSLSSPVTQFLESRPAGIVTPFGVYPIESKLKPSDRWDCWIGNTNFTITTEIALKLESVDGVSALRIMDRYSFCIGVGKMFNIRDVRTNIEKAICESGDILEREDVKNAITTLMNDSIGDKKFWSIYVSEDGDISWVADNDKTEEYVAALELFEQSKQSNGGKILNSGE